MPLKIHDMRHRAYPVRFKELPEGQAFCDPEDAERIYIKLVTGTRVCGYNAVCITELFLVYVDDDCEEIPLSAVIQIYDALPEQEDEE